jgi:alkylation response protein AidB-like acyl-CoA dehydrogenase
VAATSEFAAEQLRPAAAAAEGTQQIQQLIVARRLLGKSSAELK